MPVRVWIQFQVATSTESDASAKQSKTEQPPTPDAVSDWNEDSSERAIAGEAHRKYAGRQVRTRS